MTIQIVRPVELLRKSEQEQSGTLSTLAVFGCTTGLRVGDHFLIKSEDYTDGIVFYVNRKNLSTLYCSSLPRAISIPQLKRNGGKRVFLNITERPTFLGNW